MAKSFKDVGLYLAIDGSKDHLLSIKGYAYGKPEIGDFITPDKEIKEYQLAYKRVPKIGENGEYILANREPLRTY